MISARRGRRGRRSAPPAGEFEQAAFAQPRRGRMPGLDLASEDELDAFVRKRKDAGGVATDF